MEGPKMKKLLLAIASMLALSVSAQADEGMITEAMQYEFITSRMSDLANGTQDGLKLFTSIFSAILGGSFWLRHHIGVRRIPKSYKYLSITLMVLLTLVSIGIVVDNGWAWWGYRNQLAQITELARITGSIAHPAVPPDLLAITINVVLCIAMVVAGGMFCLFNPFGPLNRWLRALSDEPIALHANGGGDRKAQHRRGANNHPKGERRRPKETLMPPADG
jgi:hypothetical protein